VRLFVAIEIDPGVARKVATLEDELRGRAAAIAPRSRITWVLSDRLHLTVRFIGEVDEGRARALADALTPPLAVPPFDLDLGGVGTFPTSGPPRVIWIGHQSTQDALNIVEREVTARLAGCGVPPEDRAFRPHLTLGRVRDVAGLRAKPLLDGFEARQFGTSRVDAITLFESRLSPKGPTYVPLQRTALS